MFSFFAPNRFTKKVNVKKLYMYEALSILLCIPIGYIVSKIDIMKDYSIELILLYVPISMLIVFYLSFSSKKENL